MMRLRQFRLLVAGEVPETAADALFGRADDLCVETLPGGGALPVVPALDTGSGAGAGARWVAWVAFDRPAPTLVDAVVSGVRDLDVAGLGIAAAIADDSLVTAATVAERVGRPVALGPGRVFDWGEVLERLGGDPGGPDEAAFEAVTLALRLRALAPRLERMTPIRSLLV
ncbi:hypothetical protein ACQP1P_42170 [Dactylosporangium sp. CA-052675]|uniref:hypothetical protein n=1 Tax=Dactylosporangium sp. CA-052675 TaxID=3239927 RepID=UPI003D9217B9